MNRNKIIKLARHQNRNKFYVIDADLLADTDYTLEDKAVAIIGRSLHTNNPEEIAKYTSDNEETVQNAINSFNSKRLFCRSRVGVKIPYKVVQDKSLSLNQKGFLAILGIRDILQHTDDGPANIIDNWKLFTSTDVATLKTIWQSLVKLGYCTKDIYAVESKLY